MCFSTLGLSPKVLEAVTQAGYTTPTPIQAEAIPHALARRDVLGLAQTGSGKTAAFVLPMLTLLEKGRARARMPRTLILEPTRELAVQVQDAFESLGRQHKLNVALLIGGVAFDPQAAKIDRGADVVIATPGRLLDHFERGKLLLTGVELLVIDEADRMLDMGFIPDIETICSKLPAQRQTLLFSATMPPPIKKLADKFLSNPKYIEVSRPASSNLNIVQHKVKVTSRGKKDALRSLLKIDNVTTAIVFANRKTTVRELAKSLKQSGFSAGEIHGDMDQASRIAELNRFKDGSINILVASDVAARGLDVKGVSHVFNYDTPWHPDDYVHRIGRTGRAGATGRAFTFFTDEDAEAIDNVEKLTGGKIPLFEIGGEAKPEAAARQERPAREAKPAHDERPADEEKPVRAEKPAREARAAREPRPPREPRPARAERDPRPQAPVAALDAEPVAVESQNQQPAKPAPRRKPKGAAAEESEWNGPVPGFLGMSAL